MQFGYFTLTDTPPAYGTGRRNPQQFLREVLHEALLAEELGFNSVWVPEHHFGLFGCLPTPAVFLAHVAAQTTRIKLAPATVLLPCNQPLRVAEEYAMLDCISGGRIVAGMPLGSPMDANLCYGIPPIEQRERYYEAHDLILKAWQARDVFPFNGKYTQLPMVNLWPRPVQQPYPPVWVPGSGSLSTWDFAIQHDHCYCFLSYFGSKLAQGVMDGFWEFVSNSQRDANPYRTGFLQLLVVSETDARAEEEYYRHIRYFYDKCLHIAPEFAAPPGHQDYRSLVNTMKKQFKDVRSMRDELPNFTFKDFVEKGFVIAGSPATVRDRLKEAIKDLRVGNLMVLLHIGSMPHELTLKNIDLFSREVLPHVRDIWDDEWENRWWPESLRAKRALAETASQVAVPGA